MAPKETGTKKSNKIRKIKKFREAASKIELIELKAEVSVGIELHKPLPSWATKFYLKIGRRIKDEQKSPNNNKRPRHQGGRSYATGNRKRDTHPHPENTKHTAENMD